MALQGSRNGESLLADNMQDGVRIARDNPDSGVVVRIAGEGRPWNPRTITGGRVWGDIPDNSVQPGAGNGEPVTAEVLAQRQAEEAIRRETERRADEIVRKMAENKPDLPDGKTEQAVRDIAGLERDRSAYLNGKPRCRRVYCVNHNGCGKRSGRLPGKICCRSDCSRWSGIWFVTCRKRKPWAETDTGR
ncbi:Multifunctional conjugation protein TraI [Escherichia coli]|nr:Multifunctional conjugation protein TraI [Escherichia coli]